MNPAMTRGGGVALAPPPASPWLDHGVHLLTSQRVDSAGVGRCGPRIMSGAGKPWRVGGCGVAPSPQRLRLSSPGLSR